MSRFGTKFAVITDKYGVVEFQDSRFKLGPIRSDETNRGSPSARSDALPVASAASVDL